MVVFKNVINPMTGKVIPWEEMYTADDTVICYELNSEQIIGVRKVAEKHALKIYHAGCLEDLIAIPSLVIIAEPKKLSSEEIATLLNFMSETHYDNCFIFSSAPAVFIPEKTKKHLTILSDISSNQSVLEQIITQLKQKAH